VKYFGHNNRLIASVEGGNGMLSDIMSIIKDIQGLVKNTNLDKSLKSNPDGELSIAQKARKSILQFPVLVTDSINRESLTIINKALEAEYAIMVRLAVSLDDIASANEGEGGKSAYLDKIHNNISFADGSVFGHIGAELRGLKQESAKDVLRYMVENFEVINKENLTILEEDLKSESLNDLTISHVRKLSEDLSKDDKDWFDKGRKETEKNMDVAIDRHFKSNKMNSKHSAQLSSTDVKKANEMVPTIMEVELEYKVGETLKTTQLVIGIQCVSHLVPTEEMKYFVSRSIREDNIVFRAIQWTTGEISFWKDLVFSLDRVKEEASVDKNMSSRWWRRLRYMSSANKFRHLYGQKKFIPNTTIVMSMDEVENIKNTQAISLTNPGTVQSLMDIYLLLGFVIIDEIEEVAHIYDEQTKNFRVFTFDALKKEAKDAHSSSDLKTLINLIGR
jgi:hypothetical protein